MHKELPVERNGNVQFLAGKMHEDKIAGLQIRPSNRKAELQLLGCRAWHADSRICGGINHQAAAIESARRGAAEPIGLTDHGCRAVDHQLSRRGLLLNRNFTAGRRFLRMRAFMRRCRAGGECQRQKSREQRFIQVRAADIVVANAAPTIPASERNVPTHRRASQCNLSMNFSGSSVMPPHKTMRSGHNRA